jgi:hypothetical protein
VTSDPRDFKGDAIPGARAPEIFVSDPSAEADRLSTALRARGYTVIDVPLSMLVARVMAQRPDVIVLDIDADGALETATQVRAIPGAARIDILFLGEAGRTLSESSDALRQDGSGFFVRPVDVHALLRKVETVVGARSESGRPTAGGFSSLLGTASPVDALHPQGSGASAEGLAGLPDAASQRNDAYRRPVSQLPGIDIPLDSAANSSLRERFPSISPEVQQLLHGAEERSEHEVGPPSQPPQAPATPSPDEEVETVLPAELLASLDEPLDDEEDISESDSGVSTGTPSRRSAAPPADSRTPAGAGAATGPGRSGPAPPPQRRRIEQDEEPLPLTPVPRFPRTPGAHASPVSRSHQQQSPPSGDDSAQREPALRPPPVLADPALTPAQVEPYDSDAPSAPAGPVAPAPVVPPTSRGGHWHSMPPSAGPSTTRGPSFLPMSGAIAPAPGLANALPFSPPGSPGAGAAPAAPAPMAAKAAPPVVPEVLGPGDALRACAICVKERATGALVVDAEGGVRRVLFREGDVMIAASGIESESLVSYLAERGGLPKEVVPRLAGKIPAFGRHAGAALVANGHIGQDQLWPVLRGHAEWILGRVISAERGTAAFEIDPPERLRAEPSVFGGATGAEVLIEVARRAVAPSTAIAHLGGGASTVLEGPRTDLLSECALNDVEQDLVVRCAGKSLDRLTGDLPSPDLMAVLCVLVGLGVLGIQTTGAPASAAKAMQAARFDPLDAQALRGQVKVRLGLVQEGDYFALLGVPRSATAYEIRRAYLELRRAFEPSRALTAATADLADDLRLIVEVLDEAHDILRDQVRRERYRRAIEEGPPG